MKINKIPEGVCEPGVNFLVGILFIVIILLGYIFFSTLYNIVKDFLK
jgi:hypothetical protein